MDKKILFLLVVTFCASLVSSIECDSGCVVDTNCYDYGDVVEGEYCDYFTDSLVPQKTEGACVNDFECATDLNYSCFGGKCTSGYNSFIDLLNSGNLSDFCLGSGLFCYNGTQPLNSSLVDKICDSENSCYKCDSPLSWDETLKRCTTGPCDTSPGCLNVSSLNDSFITGGYCSLGSCFECNNDFEWNNLTQKCEIKSCTSSPGCLNVENLTNGLKLNRFCTTGSCFICTTGYTWSNSSGCVSLSGSNSWSVIQLSPEELIAGTPKTVKSFDTVKFSISGASYELIIQALSISSSSMSFKISPVLNNLVVKVGFEEKFDLNSDNKMDVAIKLLSINNGVAQVKVTEIPTTANPLPRVTQDPYDDMADDSDDSDGDSPKIPTSKNASYGFVALLVIFILFSLIIGIILLKKKAAQQNDRRAQINQGYQSSY